MQEAIWQGILTGLVLATFIGPIFFAVVDLGLKGNTKGAAYLALGTFLSDALTILLIYFVARGIDRDSAILQIMYFAGGGLLVLLGLKNLFKLRSEGAPVALDQKSLNKLFAKGFLINSSNPNVFFFWFGAVMGAIRSYQDRPHLVLVHFFSALLVVFSTDFLKGYSAFLLKPYIRDTTLGYLSKLSGLILIYFGIKLMLFH
jgi:threonine/homoserine/homoserine lactone efflux protein